MPVQLEGLILMPDTSANAPTTWLRDWALMMAVSQRVSLRALQTQATIRAGKFTQLGDTSRRLREFSDPSNVVRLSKRRSISGLFYMKRLPKPPSSLPIPGTRGFHLPWYMGSTFTSVCELFVIAEEALSHCPGVGTLGQVPVHVVVQAYIKLLAWVQSLPSCCARNDLNPHHVMTMQ